MMNKELELYIHIPFCLKKCDYCDFLSVVGDARQWEEYVDALSKEINLRSQTLTGYEVTTIFFGGGTPSILPLEMIERIMTIVKECFRLSGNCEITIEANPGTLTSDKLKAYRRSGINRLSIGLQSADNEELRQLSRVHTFEEFLNGFQMAREAGFDNINVDLMSALPNQQAASWEKTLETIIGLAPEHISAYSLIIEADTPFYEAYGEDDSALPDEEADRRMYHLTKALLQEAGYQRYEISNYSKPERECRHNIGYWTGVPYLGLGLGASSYIEGTRFENPSEFVLYFEKMNKEMVKTPEGPPLSQQEQMEEFMFLGLRLIKGISLAEFARRFGQDPYHIYGMIFGELAEDGLIENQNGRVYLTEKGLDLSNYVMAKFLI